MKKLFDGNHLSSYLLGVKEKITSQLNSYPEGEILNLEKEKIIESNLKVFRIKNIGINFESRTSKIGMMPLTKDQFPLHARFSLEAGKKYDCAKITYTYDITGDGIFFYLRPSKFYYQINFDTGIVQNKLKINIQTTYGSENLSDQIKNEVKGFMRRFEDEVVKNIETINQEINEFNEELPKFINDLIDQRKSKIISKKDAENDLNNF
ncbi:hypothetical protein [Chryseobacterium sp. Mn2064]|uniref:hypothetical protein n=1 Tax=Chryseobacterium sp. Mn2064 TaxID=3395263 RepID=UPI003BE447B2